MSIFDECLKDAKLSINGSDIEYIADIEKNPDGHINITNMRSQSPTTSNREKFEWEVYRRLESYGYTSGRTPNKYTIYQAIRVICAARCGHVQNRYRLSLEEFNNHMEVLDMLFPIRTDSSKEEQ